MPDARVLIVADDPLVRGGLSSLLAGQAGVRTVGQAATAEDTARVAEAYEADVLLWDLGAASASGIDRLAESVSSMSQVLVLLTDVSAAQQAWGAGVHGLLLRDAPAERLAAALAAVTEGAVVLDPDVAIVLARRGPVPPQAIEPLTTRELDVLRLLAEGLSNKGIAAGLDVSENTVKFHINAIFGKLGVQSRTEAVTRATRLGLVPL